MVEHFPHYLNGKGSSLAASAGTGVEKKAKVKFTALKTLIDDLLNIFELIDYLSFPQI